ncbi:MAG: rutA1 [Frankiales bacterium]|nr:rutA1 [Frankiales bacterium]
MRFTYAEALTDGHYYVPLAQAAEAAGYDSMTIADSLIYPSEGNADYPYTQDGNREFLQGKEFIETLVLCAVLGQATTTLRLTPFVLKLPVRPPVLVAKQAASVAFLTGNRLALGVGLSPWREDYAVMGIPWEKRGKRLDECIDIVRGLTNGGEFSFTGEFYDIQPITQTPAPTQPLPILVGGHADAALRRAVVRGDGWMHGGGPHEDLDTLLDRINEIRKEEGLEGKPFEIHVISVDAYSVDGVKKLEDRGVTDVIVGFRNPYILGPDTEPLEKKVRSLEKFAENVIAKVKG